MIAQKTRNDVQIKNQSSGNVFHMFIVSNFQKKKTVFFAILVTSSLIFDVKLSCQ